MAAAMDSAREFKNSPVMWVLNRIGPQNEAARLDKFSFYAGLLVALAAVPLSVFGVLTALKWILPVAIPAALLGLLWKHRILGKIGMVLALLSVLEAAGAAAYFHFTEAAQKRQAMAKVYEDKRATEERLKVQMREEEERATKAAAEEAARKLADEAAQKAEAERKQVEWQREYERQEKLKAQQKALDEQKRKDDALLARQRAEEEERKKRQEEAVARAKKFFDIKRTEDLEKAQVVYTEKKVQLEECEDSIKKLELEIRLCKEAIDNKQVFLDRENSPRPPPKADLERAQEEFNKLKKELAALNAKMPELQKTRARIAMEKLSAATALDELQK